MPATETRRAVLRVPYPPSVNHYWRHVMIGRSVRTLISKRGREYRAAVVRSLPSNLTPLRDRLRVTVTLCRHERRMVDLDNFGKALLDAITAAEVWADDSLIDDLRFIRGPIDEGGPGYAEVQIELIGDGQGRLFGGSDL